MPKEKTSSSDDPTNEGTQALKTLAAVAMDISLKLDKLIEAIDRRGRHHWFATPSGHQCKRCSMVVNAAHWVERQNSFCDGRK